MQTENNRQSQNTNREMLITKKSRSENRKVTIAKSKSLIAKRKKKANVSAVAKKLVVTD